MLREWTDVLLLHLIRDMETIELLGGRLEPSDLADYLMDSNKAYLWKASLDYYTSSNTCIPKHFLTAAICEKAAEGELQPEEIDSIGMLIDDVYAVPSGEFNAVMAVEYATRILEAVRVNRPISEMLQDGVAIADVFEEFQRGVQSASISVAEPIDPMANWESQLSLSKPVPLGGLEARYFNEVLSGGLVKGEIVLLLGPSGGFKTSIALDLVSAIAKNDEDYSAYLSYEQAYSSGDLSTRLMVRLSGLPREDMLVETREEMGPVNAAKMDAAKSFSHRVLIYDRSQSADQVEDIANIVRRLEKQGKLPKLVVIDQLLTWVQMLPQASSSDEHWLRKYTTGVIKKLKSQICERFGINMLVLHQITAAKNTGRKGQKFQQADSADNKQVSFWADFLLTIGTKDEDDVFQLFGAKARRGKQCNVIVQAIPELCRFRVADEYALNDSGVPENNKTKNVRLPAASKIDVKKMKQGQSI